MKTLTDYNDHIASASTLANPFPGLRAFDVWENHLFFGREDQIDTLLWKLTRNRFVSVVGTSGSGKSSLVRAGLLPVLFGGFMAQAGSAWRVAVFRPGNAPIRNMARALNADDVFGTGDDEENDQRSSIAEATLDSSSLGLVQLVRQARMAGDENLLVVVDQFEELFRFKENTHIEGAADEASAFVRLLLEGVFQREVPIYVVLTLRSDFLGDCAQFRDLPETINDGQYLIPRLRREQIRAAITGPVAVGGGKIAPRLTQQLLNDVGDNPDQLPILQHALMRTWEKWTEDHEEGEPIDLRHYDAIGGMRKALSQHADEAYNELPDDRSRQICESLFKSLTERGPDNRGIRRPTRLGDICAVAGASLAEVIDVVDLFRRPGRSFIMPPHNVPLTSDTVLDISHESLMRVWERLERWVEEDAQSVQMYRRIVESALLYEAGQAGLWHDPDLQLAEEWRQSEQPNEAWGKRYHVSFASAIRFIDRSIEQREEERREKQRRRRVGQAVGLAFLLCAAILTVWALNERASAERNFEEALAQGEIAERQKTEAERQRNLAEGQKKEAETSRTAAEQQRQRAEEQRRKAEQQQQIAEQQKREALSQRQRAETASRDALASRDAAESQRRSAVQQKQIAEAERTRAESLADSISRSRLLSIAQGLARTVQLGRAEQEELNALLALQAYNFNSDKQGNPRDPDIYGALFTAAKTMLPEEHRVLRSHSDGVRAVAYSPDGSHIISAGSDGKIVLWNGSASEARPAQLVDHDFTLRALAVDPQGKRLAYAGEDRTIRIIDLATRQQTAAFSGSEVAIFSLSWLDDDRLASLGSEGVIRIRDAASGREERALAANTRLRSMAVSSQGKMIAGGTINGEVVVWGGSSGDLTPRTIPMLAAPITSLAISRDGRQLAVGDENGTIRLLNLATPQATPVTTAGHRSTVNALAFSPDGEVLASVGNDGTLRLWDMSHPEADPVILREHGSWVWGLAFSPDGTTVVTSGFDRAVRLQPSRADLLVAPLQSQLQRNLSRREWEQYIGADIDWRRTVGTLRE